MRKLNGIVIEAEDGTMYEFDTYEDASDKGFYPTRERAYIDAQTAAYRMIDQQVEAYRQLQFYGML